MVCRMVARDSWCERSRAHGGRVPRESSCGHPVDSRRSSGRRIARGAARGPSRYSHHSVKRESLLRHLRLHGCYLKREGGAHSLWCNPKTGHTRRSRGTQRSQICWPARYAVVFLFPRLASHTRKILEERSRRGSGPLHSRAATDSISLAGSAKDIFAALSP